MQVHVLKHLDTLVPHRLRCSMSPAVELASHSQDLLTYPDHHLSHYSRAQIEVLATEINALWTMVEKKLAKLYRRTLVNSSVQRI